MFRKVRFTFPSLKYILRSISQSTDMQLEHTYKKLGRRIFIAGILTIGKTVSSYWKDTLMPIVITNCLLPI